MSLNIKPNSLKKSLVLIAISILLLSSFSKANQVNSNTLQFLSEEQISNNQITYKPEQKMYNSNFSNSENLTKILNQLYTKISAAQSKSDKSFRKFPPQSAEIKGLFSSYIHLNFIDNENSFIANLFRNKLDALDMNMFVTNFVLCSLLEAYPFSADLQEDKEKAHLQVMIGTALEALSQFRDKNYSENIPIYNFWRQQLVNGTWSQAPETMLNLINSAPKIPKFFIEFLKKIKLGNVAGFLETFELMTQFFMYAFRIPPDADDTSVNIALTGLLYKMQSELSEAASERKLIENKNENLFENLFNQINEIIKGENNQIQNDEKNQFMPAENFANKTNLNKKEKTKSKNDDFNIILNNWFKNNSEYEFLFNTLKAKAYRPFLNANFTNANYSFSTQPSETADLIDPRTYFVIRKFLQQKFAEKENLILPTTWLHDIKDEEKQYPLVTMPFRVNNIDFNVVTNFLYGTTNLIINHPDKNYVTKIFDAEMLQMYSNTVDLIVFAIKEDIFSWRPDLALLYYPSIFDFYWLISRVYSSLKNSQSEFNAFKNTNNYTYSYNNNNESIFEVLKASEIKLEKVLKNELTQLMAKRLLKSQDANEFFFVEFLGNTEKKQRNQDALFATALGLNAYMNIWTKEFTKEQLKISKADNLAYLNLKSKNLIFDSDANEEIKDTIEKLANYLIQNIGEKYASFEGAFFSGSVKSSSSNAVYFPGNYYRFLNGTYLEDHTKPENVGLTLSTAVKGFISESDYEAMLKEVYFGQVPPVEFENYTMNTFPYWSSPAMSMSVNYLALSKFRCLVK